MDRDFDEILTDFDVDDDLKKEVASIVERLSDVVRQIGSLDHLYDSIVVIPCFRLRVSPSVSRSFLRQKEH